MSDEDKMVNALWRAQQINEGKPDPGANWDKNGPGYFEVMLIIAAVYVLIHAITH